MVKLMLVSFVSAFLTVAFVQTSFAACNYPDDLDSAGRRCGGRAASVIPGGRLGGDGQYQDSQGRDRIYGTGNDPYDSNPSPYRYGQPLGTPQHPSGYQQPFGR